MMLEIIMTSYEKRQRKGQLPTRSKNGVGLMKDKSRWKSS